VFAVADGGQRTPTNLRHRAITNCAADWRESRSSGFEGIPEVERAARSGELFVGKRHHTPLAVVLVVFPGERNLGIGDGQEAMVGDRRKSDLGVGGPKSGSGKCRTELRPNHAALGESQRWGPDRADREQ